jgi:predicted transcriptional regulator YdeE
MLPSMGNIQVMFGYIWTWGFQVLYKEHSGHVWLHLNMRVLNVPCIKLETLMLICNQIWSECSLYKPLSPHAKMLPSMGNIQVMFGYIWTWGFQVLYKEHSGHVWLHLNMRVSRFIQGTFRSCLVTFEHEGFKFYTRNIQVMFGYIWTWGFQGLYKEHSGHVWLHLY